MSLNVLAWLSNYDHGAAAFSGLNPFDFRHPGGGASLFSSSILSNLASNSSTWLS
jgi:hypothetical protein